MASLKDKALVEYLVLAARRGNRTAFAHLYRKTHARLLVAAFRVTGDRAAAEDVMQEVWVELARGLKGLREPAAFMARAYRLVRWRSLDHLKRPDRHSALDETMADTGPDPEQQADVASLRRAIATLEPDHRLILQMFYSDGYSVPEIAVLLDLKAGTVKSRLFRARETLRQKLQTSVTF